MITNATKDLLAQVNAEESAYLEAQKYLGDSIELINNVINTYDYLFELVADTGIESWKYIIGHTPSSESLRPILLHMFCVACRQQSLMSFLTLLRGHSASATYYLRQTIEYVLFSVYLFEEEEAAKNWLFAPQDEIKYLGTFKITRLIKGLHKLKLFTIIEKDKLKQLTDDYEICCLQVHPSIYANGSDVTVEKINGRKRFTYQLVDKNRQQLLITNFFWHIKIHLQCLEMFGLMFKKAIATFSSNDWDCQISKVIANYDKNKEKWKTSQFR